MKNIERRALMGDKEAQRDCTEKGIVLPCPWCKCKVSDLKNTQAIKWFWRKCRFCGAESPAQETEFKANLYWNTRPALPIGRCKGCSYGYPSETEGCVVCVVYGCTVENDNFCKQFEPKEEPNNEN